jgi:hypothetical protein
VAITALGDKEKWMVKLPRVLLMSFAVCAVMVVAGLGAQAATVAEAIGMEYVDDFTPIIFEDNDFGLWVDIDSDGTLNAGDLIIGIIQIQAVTAGLGPVGGSTGIRDVSPGTGTEISGSSSGYNELTAVFGVEVAGVWTDGTKVVWSLKAVSGGSITFDDALFSGLSADWTYTFNTAGNMVDLWEGSGFDKDFDQADPSSAGNGTFVGGLGMTAAASTDPNDGSNSAGEFWFVEDNDTDPLPDVFQLNLSLVDPVTPNMTLFGREVLPNDISADSGTGHAFVPGAPLNFGLGSSMFADGIFKAGGGGGSFTSDGDFKVLFAPLPTAIWPTMLLLGALGLFRRARRKTA